MVFQFRPRVFYPGPGRSAILVQEALLFYQASGGVGKRNIIHSPYGVFISCRDVRPLISLIRYPGLPIWTDVGPVPRGICREQV